MNALRGYTAPDVPLAMPPGFNAPLAPIMPNPVLPFSMAMPQPPAPQMPAQPATPQPRAPSGPLSPDYVVQGLVERGLPMHVAQGIAGNFAVESRFDPGINEIAPLVEGSRGGFGLAQWTGPRRRQLEAFAADQGRDVSDPDLQLDFLMWEIGNSEAGNMRDTLAAPDVDTAAREFMSDFLRPGIPHADRRIAEARRIAGGNYVPSSGGTLTGGSGSPAMVGGSGGDTFAAPSGTPTGFAALAAAFAQAQQPPAAPPPMQMPQLDGPVIPMRPHNALRHMTGLPSLVEMFSRG